MNLDGLKFAEGFHRRSERRDVAVIDRMRTCTTLVGRALRSQVIWKLEGCFDVGGRVCLLAGKSLYLPSLGRPVQNLRSADRRLALLRLAPAIRFSLINVTVMVHKNRQGYR